VREKRNRLAMVTYLSLAGATSYGSSLDRIQLLSCKWQQDFSSEINSKPSGDCRNKNTKKNICESFTALTSQLSQSVSLAVVQIELNNPRNK